MKLSSQMKAISYLKAHAAEIVRNLSGQCEPLIITQNGEAKVVIHGIESYEQSQETMALLKVLALGTVRSTKARYSQRSKLSGTFENEARDANHFPAIFDRRYDPGARSAVRLHRIPLCTGKSRLCSRSNRRSFFWAL
ncbi:MAG: prevent-host-death family protein [Gammaproteobacteria bacterium]|jgi:prevent-host-death family protein